MLQGAAAGRWRHLDQFLDGRTDRWMAQSILTDDHSQVPLSVFENWAQSAPSPRSVAMLGHAQIREAWAIRGRADAANMNADAWEKFRAGLTTAEQTLEQAIELDVSSADPWVGLVTTARGLQRSRAELVHRFEQAHEREPFHPLACQAMLQGLASKWGGSDDDMFGFARWIERNAPADSPARDALPLAHLESVIAQHGEGPTVGDHFAFADVSAEITRAASSFLEATPEIARPADLGPLNAYLLALVPIDPTAARLVIECAYRIADRPTNLPWSCYSKGTVEARFRGVQQLRLKVAGSVMANGDIVGVSDPILH